MLKFGLEIDFGMIQKRYVAIFKILIFHDFSGGQSSNFRHFDKILDFDPLKNREKSQFWTKFEISDGHKIKKNENFKNPRITFLYHLDIYLCEQI